MVNYVPRIALILVLFIQCMLLLQLCWRLLCCYVVLDVLSSFDSWLVTLHRGSYMSAHVLLNLLNELGKRDKMRGLPRILSHFRNEFNKFNNTRARMLDSIYHMTLRFL